MTAKICIGLIAGLLLGQTAFAVETLTCGNVTIEEEGKSVKLSVGGASVELKATDPEKSVWEGAINGVAYEFQTDPVNVLNKPTVETCTQKF